MVKQYRPAGRRRFSYAVTAVIFGYRYACTCTCTCTCCTCTCCTCDTRNIVKERTRFFASGAANNLAHFYRPANAAWPRTSPTSIETNAAWPTPPPRPSSYLLPRPSRRGAERAAREEERLLRWAAFRAEVQIQVGRGRQLYLSVATEPSRYFICT